MGVSAFHHGWGGAVDRGSNSLSALATGKLYLLK